MLACLLHVPNSVSSLAAWSQALPSREEMYTFAPLVTKPSDIMRPIPFAPPVTRTTLPCGGGDVSMGRACTCRDESVSLALTSNRLLMSMMLSCDNETRGQFDQFEVRRLSHQGSQISGRWNKFLVLGCWFSIMRGCRSLPVTNQPSVV